MLLRTTLKWLLMGWLMTVSPDGEVEGDAQERAAGTRK